MKKRKALAVLICLCFVLVTLFSIAYVSQHADHQCGEDRCEICVCIAQVTNTLRLLRAAVITSILCAAAVAAVGFVLQCSFRLAGIGTPVSLKVQLNN